MGERDLRHISFEGATTPRRVLLASSAPVGVPAENRPGGPETGVGLARWLLSMAGLDGTAYRSESLRRRVPACLRALKVRSEREARDRVVERPELVTEAVGSLLIGVTEFFRDPEVFEGVRRVVLPALAERRPLRVWSAGCASGAELYAVACLLADAGLLDDAELLGTDCRRDAISEAQEGCLDVSRASASSEVALRRHFVRASPGGWRAADGIRRRITWEVRDVLQATEPGPWHIILWRNVGIYLDSGRAAGVCDRLTAALATGGYLVLGKAERPSVAADLLPVARCIYRKRGA